MSWLQVFALVYLISITLFFGVMMYRRPRPRPEIKVLELRSSSDTLGYAPSDTAALLWRLYPVEARNGRGTLIHPGFLHAERGRDIVFVFTVFGDKATVLEDDAALFPSDGLIAKLRLLQK